MPGMTIYNSTGWGAAKTPTGVQKGNQVFGINLGSGFESQQWPSTTTAQNTVMSQMTTAGISWVRGDCAMWTIQQNGFLLTQPLIAGATTTQVTVKPHTKNVSGSAITMPAGTVVAISDGLGNSVTVTFASSQTANTGSTPTTFTVNGFTPRTTFPVNSTMGGPYVWASSDAWFIPMVTGNGGAVTPLNVLPCLNQSPAWAMITLNAAPYYAPGYVPDPAHYAAFCAAAVTHYLPYGITAYELWNEPNLNGPLSAYTSNTAMGYASPVAFCDMAVAAYAAMKAVSSRVFVAAGTLAAADEFGTGGYAKSNCSWSSVSAGAASATITTSSAVAADAIGYLYDTNGNWPVGTVVTAVSGSNMTVIPPAWLTTGFPAIAAQSSYMGIQTTQNTHLAPDAFLTAFYVWRDYKHPNARWGDALAIHPYSYPTTPLNNLAIYGGWRMVPTLRNTLIAENDGVMSVWVTEFGAPTGSLGSTSWPTTATSATSITVTNSQASTHDVGYEVFNTSFPSGSYVGSATSGSSWVVYPPTGLVLQTGSGLSTSGAITSINVTNTSSTTITINSGTVLLLTTPGNVATQSITCSSTATISAGSSSSLPVNSFTPNFAYPASGANYHATVGSLPSSNLGTALQGSVGQTWASAGLSSSIAAASGVSFLLTPTGALPTSASFTVDEPTQLSIIQQGIQAIAVGVAGTSPTYTAIPSWPYSEGAPFFVFCWQDSRDGTFGLLRVDGTQKAAYTVFTQASALGY